MATCPCAKSTSPSCAAGSLTPGPLSIVPCRAEWKVGISHAGARPACDLYSETPHPTVQEGTVVLRHILSRSSLRIGRLCHAKSSNYSQRGSLCLHVTVSFKYFNEEVDKYACLHGNVAAFDKDSVYAVVEAKAYMARDVVKKMLQSSGLASHADFPYSAFCAKHTNASAPPGVIKSMDESYTSCCDYRLPSYSRNFPGSAVASASCGSAAGVGGVA
ncbi:hypothetical protein CHELA20_53188 [Hyphomicrobiales bacterium]|nr:hypothetical protein CHELA41_21736 [Hyphomicrobiales bacterium]CAH1683750.1 hypothetical protein CHELA20_53188 [Hyphomicrobiales bacterium]